MGKDEVLTIRPGRLVPLIFVLVFTPALIASLFFTWPPEVGWSRHLYPLGFGLFALVNAILLLRDSVYLELTPEGFTERLILTRRSRRWGEIAEFLDASDSDSERVAYRYADHRPLGILNRLNRSKAGYDAWLITTYGMKGQELAELMNAWRRRYAPKPGVAKELIDDLI